MEVATSLMTPATSEEIQEKVLQITCVSHPLSEDIGEAVTN